MTENKSTTFYLLAVLDDDSQARLAELDKLFEQSPDYRRYTPYHITLWDGDLLGEDLLAHFESVCNETPVISGALGSIGLFGLAVLFLAPLPSQPLIVLEEKICGKIDDSPFGWVPHVTLRMGQPEYIRRVAPVLAGLFEPFPIRIERAELYECGENDANLIRSFPLNG